jgi:hypothetical protein
MSLPASVPVIFATYLISFVIPSMGRFSPLSAHPSWVIRKIKSLQMARMHAPSAPNQITWIIGLICGILGIIGHFVDVPFLTEYSFILLLVGFVALALGTTFRQL